eukprot:TRINITY_DN12698_c0_g1_i2.p1 TRINITY_DN12698_c0_g1~~TRINITY_DN12698_c0_g1_i2.p1  ORF type:complete len:379 (-),score=51.33 TRINITY_DN12698_c0_g1_i2:9-1145(-)
MFSLKYLVIAVLPNAERFEEKDHHNVTCLMEALWSQFFGLASVSWNAMISINLLISIANPFANTSTKEVIYHIYVWSLTTTTTVVMVAGDYYNASGDGTCWLHGRDKIGWPLFYGWLVGYQILSISTLIYVGLRTGSLARAEEYQFRVLFRMGLYVVIFLTTWLGPLAHEVYQFYTSRWGDRRTLEIFFSYYNMIGVSSQGLANACVWFSNPTFFLAIKDKYMKRRSSQGKSKEKGLLEDERNDLQLLTLVLRKNILTCILLAIMQCLDTLRTNKTRNSNGKERAITKQDCTEIRHFIFQASDLDFETNESLKNGTQDGTSDRDPEHLFTSTSFSFYDFSPRAFERIRLLSGVNPDQYRKSLHPYKFLQHINNQKFTD